MHTSLMIAKLRPSSVLFQAAVIAVLLVLLGSALDDSSPVVRLVFAQTTSVENATTTMTTAAGSTAPGSNSNESVDSEYENVAAETDLNAVLSDIAQLSGNVFYAPGLSSSCSVLATPPASTPAGGDVSKCLSSLHSCRIPSNERENLDSAACPPSVVSCTEEYAMCLQRAAVAWAQSQGEADSALGLCGWPALFIDEAMQLGSQATEQCIVFIKQYSTIYHNCANDPVAICVTMGSHLAHALKNSLSDALLYVDMSVKNELYPRGLPRIVIARKDGPECANETSNTTSEKCPRPYVDGKCQCPDSVAQSFIAFTPDALTAKDGTCKTLPSEFSFCVDPNGGGTDPIENVSFAMGPAVVSAALNSAAARRLEEQQRAAAEACDSDKTLRQFKLIAPKSRTDSTKEIKTLNVCAPEYTNVYFVSTSDGSCHQPRANVSCVCDKGVLSTAVPVTLYNTTTRKSVGGLLVICNYALPPGITQQQVASAALNAVAALAGGPAAVSLQIASAASLIDCDSNVSRASELGGREVLAPIKIGSSVANRWIFVMIILFGVPLLHAGIAAIIALVTWKRGSEVALEPPADEMLGDSSSDDDEKDEQEHEGGGGHGDDAKPGISGVTHGPGIQHQQQQQKQPLTQGPSIVGAPGAGGADGEVQLNDGCEAACSCIVLHCASLCKKNKDGDNNNNGNKLKHIPLKDAAKKRKLEEILQRRSHGAAAPSSPEPFAENEDLRRPQQAISGTGSDSGSDDLVIHIDDDDEEDEEATAAERGNGNNKDNDITNNENSPVRRIQFTKEEEELIAKELEQRNASWAAHFDAACSLVRFPHFSLILARILFQGQVYESMRLVARGTQPWHYALGAIGLVGTLLYLALFAWVSYRAHHERRSCFWRYRVAYQDRRNEEEKKSRLRAAGKAVGFTGTWNRLFFFVRRYEAVFGSCTGTSERLWWVPVWPLMKMIITAILSGISVAPGRACEAVYAIMIALLFSSAFLSIYARADRLRFETFANTFLQIATGFMLLAVVSSETFGKGADAKVYLVVLYAGTAFSVITTLFGVHDALFGLDREKAEAEAPWRLGIPDEEEEKEAEEGEHGNDKKVVVDDAENGDNRDGTDEGRGAGRLNSGDGGGSHVQLEDDNCAQVLCSWFVLACASWCKRLANEPSTADASSPAPAPTVPATATAAEVAPAVAAPTGGATSLELIEMEERKKPADASAITCAICSQNKKREAFSSFEQGELQPRCSACRDKQLQEEQDAAEACLLLLRLH